MKNVLLLVHDDDGQEARLQAALDLTRALDGHLTCLDVAVMPVGMIGEYPDATGQAMLMDIERTREAKNREDIEPRLQREGVAWNWIDVIDTIGDAVIDAAQLADVIVVNRKLDGGMGPDMLDIASRVVMHARKPVMAVPQGLRRLDTGKALVAWDGRECCAANLRACVPLLALADEVEVFMVRDGADRTDPAEAAEYLARHGINVEVRIVDDAKARPDDLIAQECERWGASYVLMGAYGRGRLLEAFGGVTKRMLATSKIPLVMGH